MIFDYINWTVSPVLYSGFVEIRWYGLFFAVGFAIGYFIVSKMFKREGKPDTWVDTLLLYLIVATIVGARLGHCLFYQPEYYLSRPLEILKIWEGGLASHGGTIGIILVMWLFSRRVTKENILWILDRICVPVALVGAMIRMGNLMNHELYGHATQLPWAFCFVTNIRAWLNGADPMFSEPSHPTQIYESLTYLTLFVILSYMYWKRHAEQRPGLLLGVFFVGTFLSRIFVEMIKHATVFIGSGENLNMGQFLSIPFVIAGIWLIIRAMRLPRKTS